MATQSSSIVGFTSDFINDDLVNRILSTIDTKAKLSTWSIFELNNSLDNAFLSRVGSDKAKARILGLIGMHIMYTLPDSEQTYCKDVVFKSKTRGHETVDFLSGLLKGCDPEYIDLYKKHLTNYGYAETDYRELNCIKMSALYPVMPEIYWSRMDEDNDIFIFAMEFISPQRFSHIDTSKDLSVWQEIDIISVLNGMALFHSKYYSYDMSILEDKGFVHGSTKYLREMGPTWKVLINKVYTSSPELLQNDCSLIKNVLDNIDKVDNILRECPNTLIHNDFSPRNICLRKKANSIHGDTMHSLCVYDWELACISLPQIDLAQFLITCLPVGTSLKLWHKYVNVYIVHLKESLGDSLRPEYKHHLQFESFCQTFDMCVLERLVQLILLGVLHKTVSFKTLQREISVALGYVQVVKDKYTFLL